MNFVERGVDFMLHQEILYTQGLNLNYHCFTYILIVVAQKIIIRSLPRFQAEKGAAGRGCRGRQHS